MINPHKLRATVAKTTTKSILTNTASSAINAINFKDGEFSFDSDKFVDGAFGFEAMTGYMVGAFTTALSTELHGQLDTTDNKFYGAAIDLGSAMAGEALKYGMYYIDTAVKNSGAPLKEISKLAYSRLGGVTFNIANVGALLDLARSLGVANQDGYSALDEEKFAKVTQALSNTGLIEMNFGANGMSMKLGTGGIDLAGNLYKLGKGIVVKEMIKQYAEENGTDMKTMLTELYGRGDFAAMDTVMRVLSGKDSIVEGLDGSEGGESNSDISAVTKADEKGNRTIYIKDMSDALQSVVVMQHEAWRDGKVDSRNQAETLKAVLSHVQITMTLINDYGDGVLSSTDKGATFEKEAKFITDALEKGDMAMVSAYVGTMYDSSGDYMGIRRLNAGKLIDLLSGKHPGFELPEDMDPNQKIFYAMLGLDNAADFGVQYAEGVDDFFFKGAFAKILNKFNKDLEIGTELDDIVDDKLIHDYFGPLVSTLSDLFKTPGDAKKAFSNAAGAELAMDAIDQMGLPDEFAALLKKEVNKQYFNYIVDTYDTLIPGAKDSMKDLSPLFKAAKIVSSVFDSILQSGIEDDLESYMGKAGIPLYAGSREQLMDNMGFAFMNMVTGVDPDDAYDAFNVAYPDFADGLGGVPEWFLSIEMNSDVFLDPDKNLQQAIDNFRGELSDFLDYDFEPHRPLDLYTYGEGTDAEAALFNVLCDLEYASKLSSTYDLLQVYKGVEKYIRNNFKDVDPMISYNRDKDVQSIAPAIINELINFWGTESKFENKMTPWDFCWRANEINDAYKLGWNEVTGKSWDDLTEAVMQYQQEWKLPVTGYMDNYSWAWLELSFDAKADY